MRLLAFLAALCAVTASAAELRIVRVYTGWRDAASFKRISEYFTGREDNRDQIVIRTQPRDRGGYYFLVRTENRGTATEARLMLHVITPASNVPREFAFRTTLPAGKAVFNLGLTSADWPNPEIDAVAWRLEIFDADGTLLASEKSYLWEKPSD